MNPSKYQRRWYSPIPAERPKRAGTQRHYPNELIKLIDPQPNGCWLWRGTIHTTGYPIYKGWDSARRVIFEAFCRPLKEGELLYGRIKTCHDTLCVCPWHQRITKRKNMSEGNKADWIPPEKRSNTSSTLDASELEFLDRLSEIGKGLMLNDLPFPTAQHLIRFGYLKAIPTDENKAILEITPKGWEMVRVRRRRRDAPSR